MRELTWYSLISPLLYGSIYIERRWNLEDEVKVIARIDRKKKVRLYHVLLDEGITFSEWLRRNIDAYLKEKEPKLKRRKGKEG